MRVATGIDCTPDEARQAAPTAKLEAQLADVAERFSRDAVPRSWVTLAPSTPDAMAGMVKGFFQAAEGGSTSRGSHA